MMILYGIKNCDSVKKARKALDEQGVEYIFHDFRVDGIELAKVENWMELLGGALVNKRSTTWKQLTDAEKENVTASLICENPTLIKRPLIECDKGVFVGKVDQIL